MPQPQTPRRSSRPLKTGAARPGQDMLTVKQQAAQFPAVGMTLKSYRYDSKDRNNRRGQPLNVIPKSRWQRLKSKVTLKRVVITLAIVLLVVGGWVGGKFAYNAHKLFGGNIFGVLKPTKLRGESDGRVNILLAGNSADDAGHQGGQLTDSIMLVSIDTRHNKAFMLSIPRDLWVDLGSSHQKINDAYVVGENNDFSSAGYPSGGMGKLEKVVSENFGLPIHYYALINYNAFKQAVDAVGGIDITVKSTDPRGLYDPNIDYTTKGPLVKLSNGQHHLSGQQALNLARARGDSYYSYGFAGSDFDRTEHQRQMLVALKSKAVSAGVLSNPAKLSSLSDAIGNNVKTDFNTGEVRRLYDLFKQIDNRNIQSLSLNKVNGKSLLASYRSPQGQSALIPAAGVDDFSDIQAFINRQTSSDPVVQESAEVVVLNGTNVNGLAAKVKNKLTAKHIVVQKIGDAGVASQATTAIIDLSGGAKPHTSTALTKLFGNHLTTQNPYGKLYDADFIVVAGADQAVKSSSSTSQ